MQIKFKAIALLFSILCPLSALSEQIVLNGSSGEARRDVNERNGQCVLSPQCLYVRLMPPGEPMPVIELREAKQMSCEHTFAPCDQEKIEAAYHVRQMNQRIAPNTGAIFTRDTSKPEFGEAYRDPSGLIWSGVITRGTAAAAEVHCMYRGGRLPTEVELNQLAMYLGKGTDKGYNPFLADGKTDILPELSKRSVWSSTLHGWINKDHRFALNGWKGSGWSVYENDSLMSVICVSKN